MDPASVLRVGFQTQPASLHGLLLSLSRLELVDVCAESKYSVSGLAGRAVQAGDEDGDQHGRGAEPEGVRGLRPDARCVFCHN